MTVCFKDDLIFYINLLLTRSSCFLFQRRSEVIATYALCGFTNFLGLGVLLGGLGPMAPSRQGDMAKIALRTLFAATIACFMTASIAGKFSELWLLKTVKTRVEITIK